MHDSTIRQLTMRAGIQLANKLIIINKK